MKFTNVLIFPVILTFYLPLSGSDTLILSAMKIDSIANVEEIVKNSSFIKANHPYLQYTGRMDISRPEKPKCWAPGVYLKIRMYGKNCKLIVHDEEPDEGKHNYLGIVVDESTPLRFQLKGKTNLVNLTDILDEREHIITVCKNTEANIGYIEFGGMICDSLLPPPEKPSRKMECIGNSITCGTGADTSEIPCGAREWHDQHNAWMSYGPLVARYFNAQWHLTSISGVGLIHSCCENDFIITDVYDKTSLLKDTQPWDFSEYTPDIVTICLGQNDGIQDSVEFTRAYVSFIGNIRSHYPEAHIICLLSPMANKELRKVQTKHITSVVKTLNTGGDKKIYKYFFKEIYNHGCETHPSLKEHREIAEELQEFIESVLSW